MRKNWIWLAALLLGATSTVVGKYKIKPLEVKPASDYPSRQEAQSLVIAAKPFTTESEILDVFDSKRLYERGIIPVLIVLENNNNFGIELYREDVFLVGPDGTNVPTLEIWEVLARISSKKPLSEDPSRRIRKQRIDGNMRADFEKKALERMLVPPHETAHGVVFFRVPEPESVSQMLLYLPEIVNLVENEPLMFFEFPLKDSFLR